MGTKISRPLIAHIASRATPTALQNPPEAAAPALARNAEISVRLAAAATAAWAAAVSAVTGCSSISSINTLADADTLRGSNVGSIPRCLKTPARTFNCSETKLATVRPVCAPKPP